MPDAKPGAERAAVFETTYRRYLSQVAQLDLARLTAPLGVRLEAGHAVVPFFNQEFRVGADGIRDDQGQRPDFSTRVVLCKYLLLCPFSPPAAGDWVHYRGFKDAAPLLGYFAHNVEQPLTARFAGRLADLDDACRSLDGSNVPLGLAYDRVVQLAALPRVPLLLLFNDADAEFGAEGRVLFRSSAIAYLDAECLAMVGSLLTSKLRQAAGGAASSGKMK